MTVQEIFFYPQELKAKSPIDLLAFAEGTGRRKRAAHA